MKNLLCVPSKHRIFWHWTYNFSVNKLTKSTAKYFFNWCSYKYSNFNELVYNCNAFLRIVCSLKDIVKELALDFLFCFENLLLV